MPCLGCPAWLHLILYESASVDPLHALDVLHHIVAREAVLDVPDPARAWPSGMASSAESPYELHTVSISPATKTPVMNGREMRPHAAVQGEGEL
jgi:hypothetical protein